MAPRLLVIPEHDLESHRQLQLVKRTLFGEDVDSKEGGRGREELQDTHPTPRVTHHQHCTVVVLRVKPLEEEGMGGRVEGRRGGGEEERK